MADIHYMPNTGSNTAPYDTWAKAATLWSSAIAAMVAGDRLLISSADSIGATSFTTTFPGTAANPNYVLSGTPDTVSGITALVPGAVLQSSGTSGHIFAGSVYCYGLDLLDSSASSTESTYGGGSNNNQVYDTCTFRNSGSSSSSRIVFGSSTAATSSRVTLRNCNFRLANAGQRIYVDGHVEIVGGAWLSAGTSPTGVFFLAEGDRGAILRVAGFDFSTLAAGVNIVQTINGVAVLAEFLNCKLPASHSGVLFTTPKAGQVLRWLHGDNADTNYRFQESHYQGVLTNEIVIVRSGGASDGTTSMSVKAVSNANAGYPAAPLWIDVAPIWNTTIGSSVTITVHVVHDSVTALNDDELGLQVEYQGTSGNPITSFAFDERAILGSAAAQSSSSETWTTTGLTNPNKQQVSVTVTPQEIGWIRAQVRLFKASKTIYVCPQTELS